MISIQQLDKTFIQPGGDRAHALNNVSLDIPEGQWMCVVGTNGSGKSSLLNALAGRFLPDKGTISIEGVNVTRRPEHKRASLVGRVFQDPFQGSCPNMTVLENLRMARLRGQRRTLKLGLHRRERDEYAQKLERLGMRLENRLHALVGTLSGGQRQALTLLMATLHRPQILLLDEHTAALDPAAAERIAQITQEIVRENHLTTLMVTHSPKQALELGDRTVMIHHGQVAFDWDENERRDKDIQDLMDAFTRLQLESALS